MTSIEGFSKYLIYENGDVYSKIKKKIMKQCMCKRGYCYIKILNDNGNRKNMKIHRLVAIAYIPNPENKPQVDHIDQNKSNNNVSNLRWATKCENMQNIKQALKTNKLGEKNISFYKNHKSQYYRFTKTINNKTHYKLLKTLEEAIEYRDNYLFENQN